MLVLALQFSKGDAQRLPTSWVRTDATTGTLNQSGANAAAVELEGSCRAWSERPWSAWTWADSLKTEEKTKTIDPRSRGGRILTTLDDDSNDPPMHQLGTGSNRVGRMPTND
jgi:hypothetical protein